MIWGEVFGVVVGMSGVVFFTSDAPWFAKLAVLSAVVVGIAVYIARRPNT